MKKLFYVLLGVIVISFMQVNVLASDGKELTDWTNLSGYLFTANGVQDGKAHPAEIKKIAQGLNYKCDGYYMSGDTNYSGIFLNDMVKADGFSIEIQVNVCPGGTGDDLWFCVALLNKKQVFNNYDTTQSLGYVSLMRPQSTKIQYTCFQDDGQTPWLSSLLTNKIISVNPRNTFTYTFVKDINQNYSVKLKYGSTETTLPGTFDKLNNIFTDGKAYLLVSTCTGTGVPWDITITKINGISLSSGSSSSSTASSTAGSSSPASSISSSKTNSNNQSALPSTTNSVVSGTGSQSDTASTENDTAVGLVSNSSSKVDLKGEIVAAVNKNIKVDNKQLKVKLPDGMTISELKKGIAVAQGYKIEVLNSDGNIAKNESAAITTDMVMQLYSNDKPLSTAYGFIFDNNSSSSSFPLVLIILIIIALIGAGVGTWRFLLHKKKVF